MGRIGIMTYSVVKRDRRLVGFNEQIIMAAIRKAFENTNQLADLGTVSKIIDHLDIEDNMKVSDIQETLERVLLSFQMKEESQSGKYDRRHDNPGRPEVTRLCAPLPDWKVISLLKRVGRQLRKFVDKPLQLFTCYYLALFALIKTESYSGKIKYYWQLLVKYIKGFRVPALRTMQDAIDKLSNWRNNIKKLVFTTAEKLKYRAWSKLQDMIEELLTDLEPAFKVA